MPPRKIKVVDVINDACDDNELPGAIEDIPEPIEEQTPQPVEEGVEQETQVKQPVSNEKTVELAECPDCKKKMQKKTCICFINEYKPRTLAISAINSSTLPNRYTSS